MLSMQLLLYSGFIVMTLTTVIDAFVLGAKKGGATVGDFTLAQYGANLVSVPQKAILGGAIGILTIAWKNKNFDEIKRVYSRSCINLSLMALFSRNSFPGFRPLRPKRLHIINLDVLAVVRETLNILCRCRRKW